MVTMGKYVRIMWRENGSNILHHMDGHVSKLGQGRICVETNNGHRMGFALDKITVGEATQYGNTLRPATMPQITHIKCYANGVGFTRKGGKSHFSTGRSFTSESRSFAQHA